MTLRTIIDNVSSEIGYQIDTTASSYINSGDTLTKQLVAMTNRIAVEMFESYNWWQFNKTASLTLVDSTATYALPGDFSSYHFDTFWNQSNRWRVFGPMSAQEYGQYNGLSYTSLIGNRFMLRGVSNNQIVIYPTPGADIAGQIIVYEYISERPVRPWTWTASTSLGTKAYTFYNGNYYSLVSGTVTGSTAPTHTSGSVSDGSCTWAYYDGAYPQFLNDSDINILPERVLELGVIERIAEIKQLNVSPKYQTQLDEEYSKQIVGKSLYTASTTGPYMWAERGRVNFGGFTS